MKEIYIVVFNGANGYMFIESVWTTRDMALTAIQYHCAQGAGSGKSNTLDYAIIERYINASIIPRESLHER